MDIAQLGFAIDSSQANTAATNLDKLTDASKRAETGSERVQRQAEQTAASVRQMSDQVSRAAGATTASYDAMGASASAFMAQSAAVQAMIDKEVATLAEAAAARKAYDAAMKSGALTQEEYGAAVAVLDKQEQALIATQAKQAASIEKLAASYLQGSGAAEKLAADQARLDEAMAAGIISQERYAAASAAVAAEQKALSSALAQVNLQTSFARQEFGRMSADAISGQWERLDRSAVTLAGHTGILNAALVALLSPLGLLAAAVAAVAAAYITFTGRDNDLNRAIIATGGYAGSTAQQLRELAVQAEQADGRVHGTTDAVLALANSGKFAGETLKLAGEGAAAFADLTGQKLEKAVAEFEKLGTDPLKVLTELDEKFHFLTASEIEQVAALEQVGDKAGATAEAVRILTDAMVSRDQQVRQTLHGWAGLMNSLADAAHTVTTRVGEFLDKIADGKNGGIGGLLAMGPSGALLQAAGAGLTPGSHEVGDQFRNVLGGSSGATDATLAATQAQANFNHTLAETSVEVNKEVAAMQKHLDAMSKSREETALDAEQRALDNAARAKGAALTDAEADAIQRTYAPLVALAKAEDAAAAAKKHHRDTTEDLAKASKAWADELDKVRGALDPAAEAQAKYSIGMRELQERAEALAIAGGDVDVIIKQWQEGEALLKDRLDETNAALDKRAGVLENYLSKLSEDARIDAFTEKERFVAQAVDEVTKSYEENVKNHIAMTKSLDEVRAGAAAAADKFYDYKQAIDFAKKGSQDFEREAAGGFTQFFQLIGKGLTGGVKSFKDFGRAILDDFKNVIAQMIATALELRFLGPLMASLGFSPAAYGGAGGITSLGGGGGGIFGQAFNSFFGGGSSGGAGGFSLFSPTSWISAGKNLWDGFSSFFGGGAASGAMSGGGGTLLDYGAIQGMSGGAGGGTLLNYGAGGAVTPGAVSPGFWGNGMGSYGGVLGIAGGIYAGYNEYNAAGGGLGGLAGGAAYGIGTAALAGAAGTALTAGITAGLAAIPVVGWIAIAAMAVNMISGGKLFGTAWQTKTAGVDLNIGPDGGTAHTWEYQQKQGALFSGMKSRTKDIASSPEAIQAAQDFFDQIKKTMTDAAHALEIDVPPVIEASLKTVNEYDKKGHLKSTKYLVDAFGQQWEEATADLAAKRIQADAILETIAHSTVGKDALAIAAQFQGSADKLADAAQTMLAATADIQSKHGLLGLNSTLADTLAEVQKLQQGDETLLQTYTRLQQETQGLRQLFDQLGFMAGKTGAQFVEFADGLSKVYGGVQNAIQALTTFFQEYAAFDNLGQHQSDYLKSQKDTLLKAVGEDPNETMQQFWTDFAKVQDTLSPEDLAKWVAAGDALYRFNDAMGTTPQKLAEAAAAQAKAKQAYEDFMAPFRTATDGLTDFQHSILNLGSSLQSAIAQANALARAAGMQGASAEDVAKIIQVAAEQGAAALRQFRQQEQDLASQLYGQDYIAGIEQKIAAAKAENNTQGYSQILPLLKQLHDAQANQQHQVDNSRFMQAQQLAQMLGQDSAVGGGDVNEILKSLGVPIDAFAKDLHLQTSQLKDYLQHQVDVAKAGLDTANNTGLMTNYLRDVRDILAGIPITDGGSAFDPVDYPFGNRTPGDYQHGGRFAPGGRFQASSAPETRPTIADAQQAPDMRQVANAINSNTTAVANQLAAIGARLTSLEGTLNYHGKIRMSA